MRNYPKDCRRFCAMASAAIRTGRREMCVSRRGLDLRVAEELSDHRQVMPKRRQRRKGVAQIVDADVLYRAGADALPEGLQITQWLAGQGAGDHPRIAVDGLAFCSSSTTGRPTCTTFARSRKFRQAQARLLEIDVGPLQGHDLVHIRRRAAILAARLLILTGCR